MSLPALPDGLSDITGRYDAILCDVWGVIHTDARRLRTPAWRCNVLWIPGRWS